MTSVEKEQLTELSKLYPCIWNLRAKAFKDTTRGKKDTIAFNKKYNCKFIKAI